MTPLMKQYWDIKSLHKDKILFFRMGDFFELFYEDAITAAPILGIALTSRNRKAEDETPMCGVPHFSVPGQINKLLKQGFKVALCDQIEDPKEAKGIVKRAVTRVLSPGMVYDPDNLESGRANYIAAFDFESVAFLEVSTGEAFYYEVTNLERISTLHLFRPVEFVLSASQKADYETVCNQLSLKFHETVWGDEELDACTRLKNYAIEMQGEDLRQTLPQFEKRSFIKRLVLGPQTLRHLEVFENYRGDSKGSLLSVVDKTKTSGGARFLRYWISTPTSDRALLKTRHDQVHAWTQDMGKLKNLRGCLAALGDIERRVMKISNPSCNPRDIVSLALSLQAGCEMSRAEVRDHDRLNTDLLKAETLMRDILQSFVEEPPVSAREGRIFQKGLSVDLDRLIQLTDDADSALLEMETREKNATGISSLKIRYNSVFGFYIEITHAHKDKVPGHYQRKQTLVNAERFATPELLDLEHQILAARSKREKLEFELFNDWKQKILTHVSVLLTLAHAWSELDVITSFAWLALEHRYVRPEFFPEGTKTGEIKLLGSRHPVVERLVSTPFVSNDICLAKSSCLLLTGPNMAGKSTIMRQVALTCLLAQVGSFVPASSAVLPLFSGLLTRIGSSDALWEGLSTFMVEMTETAELLKNANSDTLVILDEIGRGTSTFDGMSLAQAILEELVHNLKPTTFFATHYHELTELASHFPDVRNAHMKLKEQKGNLTFLYTLTNGAANRSYGIQVGKIAGLPTQVIARAEVILKEKELTSHQLEEHILEALPLEKSQLSLFDTAKNKEREFLQEMRDWNMEKLSPIDVFQKVLAMKREFSSN